MQISKTVLAKWLMLALSVIIMANLNGVFGVYLKIAEPFSPIILLCCVLIVPLVSPKQSYYHLGFYLFWLFFASYWITGFLASLYYDFNGDNVWDETRDIITTLIIFTTYYTYVKSLPGEAAVQRYMQMILVVFVATALGGVLERQLGLTSFYFEEETLRTLGFFGNPNETGLQCNLLILLATYLFVDNRLRLVWVIPIIAIAVLGALFSFSKSAMILTVVLVLYFLLYMLMHFGYLSGKLRRQYLGFLSVLIIVILGVVIPSFTQFYTDAKSYERRRIDAIYELVVEGEINDKTTSKRSRVVPRALDLVSKRPFSGYGLHAFSKTGLVDENIGVHNTYLKILGEGGVLTFILWGAFVTFLGIQALRSGSRAETYFVVGVLMIFLAYFMVSHTILSRKHDGWLSARQSQLLE